MSRMGTLIIGVLVLGALGAAAWGAGSDLPYAGSAVLGRSGAIRGIVLCGEGDGETGGATTPSPRAWSTVWVQGAGFSARTDDQGRFRIDYVPAGSYTLGVQTAGMPIRGEFTVVVKQGAVTDAGELVVSGGCGQCGGQGHEGGGEAGHEGGDEGCCSAT